MSTISAKRINVCTLLAVNEDKAIRETRLILSLLKSNVQFGLNFDIIRKECMHSAFPTLSGKCDVWSACAAFSMLIPDLHGILSNGKQGNS